MKTKRSATAWTWIAGLGLAALLGVLPQQAAADLSEGFETGMPTAYSSGDYTLGSGSWNFTNVIRGTTKYSGLYSCQIRSSTGAQARTPTLSGGVGTISFWVVSSTTTGGLQVNLSTDGGATWTAAAGSPFTGLGTTYVQKQITVDNASVNKVQFYRTAGTISIDEVVITPNASSAGTLAIDNTGNPSASTVYRSDTGKLVFGLQLTATTGPVGFTGVTLTRTLGGSAASGDFYNYKLYYDSNGDGSASGETQLSTTQADGSTVVFSSISGQSVAVGTPRKYLVTADVLGTAVKGGTMNLKINANGDVTSDATSITSTAPYPSSAVDHTVGNATPAATPQIVAADEDMDETITLAGTDTDGDTLSYIISTLPAAGKLYQTADGTTKGSEITSVPTTVSDTSHRVIYVTAANGNGSGYGNFGFKVNDGTTDSSEATVTVNVSAVSDAPTISVNPAISGDAVVDETLTTTSGTWNRPANPSGTITYSYQWYRDDDQTAGGETAIGSDQNTYDVVAADVGKYIKVVVTSTENSEASTPAASSYVGPVVAGGAPEQWTYLVHQGTPVYTYYLGDNLLYQFQFAINTDTTGWTVEYGLGKPTGGAGWTWNSGTYASNHNSDAYWTSDQSEFQFTDTGNYYYAGRFTSDDVPPYVYYAMDDWTSDNLTLSAVNYFTVSAINDPSGQAAAANAGSPAHEIDLEWTENAQSHDVMVVRKLSTDSWTEPTQGTGYSVSGTLGDGTVVYKGAGVDFTDTGLAEDTTYDYKFYSVNNDYYSAGVTAQATTDVCEPDAPTALYASDTNETSFIASWTAPAAGNPPTNYYIDVSTDSDFSVPVAPKSTLAAGDIAIIGANFDVADDFSFVALVDIADATVIYFTENGWTNDTFRPGEGTYIWSNSTAGAISAGTIITMSNNFASTGTWLSGGGTWALSSSGDQIIAYQTDGSTITPIFAVNSDGTGWQDYATSANNSGLPTGLTDGTTAMAIDEIDNFVYDMSTTSGTQAQLLAAIGNKANWLGDDATPYTLPPAGTFSVTAGTTPSYVTGYSNLLVGLVTSFEVTGLDPETTYYFRVRGEGEESCVGADSTTANVTTLEEEITDYWTLLNDRGAPWHTYTLGDALSDQFQFAINTDTTGWEVEYGLGQSTDGTGWTWADATYVTQSGDNRYWTSPAGTVQFTAVGDWYYAGRFTSLEPRAYYAAIDWTNTPDNLTLAAASYITVEAIEDPSGQTATQNVTEPTTQIDLAWTQNEAGNDVMIVRKLASSSWTEPTQGTAYSVFDSIGAGTVIYVGSGVGSNESGLAPGTTYDYKFYSVNYDYYSPGVTAQASTLACEPDAPTGLNASDMDSDSFTANWTAPAAGNPPTNYYLDVSLEDDFATGAGALIISEVADPFDQPNAKFVELYNASGAAIDFDASTWYLWRQANGTTWTNIQLSGTIAAGGTHVIANSSTYDSTYSMAADQYSSITISGNGDDGYFLVQGGTAESMGTIVDAYGVVDQDGTGQTWEYLDTHAVRNSAVALPNATWTASEWTIATPTVNAAAMSPDAHVCTGGGAASFVPGYENLLLGDVTSVDVTGLCPNRTYYFRVRAEGEAGCLGANSTTEDVTTDKGVLTVTGAVADDKDYDGGTDATVNFAGASLDGILCSDDVALDSSAYSADFASEDADEDIAVTVSGLALSGDDAGNYELAELTGLMADIDPAELTVSEAIAVDKDYDGTMDATITGAILVGVIGTDDVSLDSLAGTFAQSDAGDDIAVTAALTLTGPDAGNYYLTQPTGLTADINPLAVTIYPNAGQSKVYGEAEPKSFTFTLSTPLVGDDEFTGDLGRVAGEDVGFYNYTLGSLDAGANYELSLGGTAQFEITAKELTVTGATADDKPYDGTAAATISGATLVGVVGTDDVELDALVGTFAQIDADTDILVTAALTLTGADASNYTLTQPTGLLGDIDPLPISILPTPGQSKIEGDPDPLPYTYTPSPALLGSDGFTGALGREAGETVGFYAYTLNDLSAGGNYALSLSGSADEFEIKEPTSVVLYYFTAGYENGQVVLRWRTASEEDTVGFWVERKAGDAWVRVNDAIIDSQDAMGAKYSLVDPGAELGGTYTYQVVEVESDGEDIHGPFVRTISALGFAAVDPIVVTPDGVLIRWLSRAEEVYKILRATDLTQGFETISSGIEATPPENEFLDPEAGSIGMYMIQVDDE